MKRGAPFAAADIPRPDPLHSRVGLELILTSLQHHDDVATPLGSRSRGRRVMHRARATPILPSARVGDWERTSGPWRRERATRPQDEHASQVNDDAQDRTRRVGCDGQREQTHVGVTASSSLPRAQDSST